MKLILLHFDGWNVGFRDDFAKTFLEFDDADEAYNIMVHWTMWIKGADI